MYGYWGKLLRVNLSELSYQIEHIPEEVIFKFVGGGALGAHYLIKEVPAGVDPLSIENKVIFAVGAMQAINVPGNAKWSIMTISPLTGTFADSAGTGRLAMSFKKCGYDAMIIEGRADKPIYLYLHDDGVEFRSASNIWGQFTRETSEMIKEELGNKRINALNIGPAGEKMHPIACVTCDGHSFAGREGVGAVMGSKNLKAVACWGSREVPVYDKENADRVCRELFKLIHTNGAGQRQFGTTGSVSKLEAMGNLPIKYWRGEAFAFQATKISAPYYNELLNVKPRPCENCPVGCHRHIDVMLDNGEHLDCNGPEYETLGMFGSNCMVSDLLAVCKANDLCNQYGIDTVSAGAYVAFLMECYEYGWITDNDIGGIQLLWGNGEAMLDILERIIHLDGIGEIFKRGIKGAASLIGHEADKIIVQVKNSDYAAHDGRVAYAMGLNYATGTRGACHMRGANLGWVTGRTIPELDLCDPVDPHNPETSPLCCRLAQITSALLNNLTLCYFMVGNGFSLSKQAEVFNLICGTQLDPKELCLTAERGHILQRLIGNRNGYRRKDDTIPEKMKISALVGPRKGLAFTDEMFNKMLDAYYSLFGYDSNGVPTKECLLSLDLAEYLDYIPQT